MKKKIRYDIPIRVICAILFSTFSFLYIYMLQGELLALVQDHLAKGQTSNNTLITASLITVLLMVLRSLINKVGGLHGRFEAWSYLPTCALLALITKVDGTFSYSGVQWAVVMVVVALVYIFFVWIDNNTFEPREVSFFQQLSPNLGVMALLFVLTGWWGNNASAGHMELAAWRYTHAEQYDKVLRVGERSTDCNADLTALRNLALAKTGQLGTKLFAYPQLYGAEGLLMNRYNVQTPSYGAMEFYGALGAIPYGGEDAEAFYKRMLMKTGAEIYREMYLAALLLNKNLTDFAVQTARGTENEVVVLDGAPTYHQEAWLIYNEQHPFSPISFTPDEAVAQRYCDYLTLREACDDDPIVMQNRCKEAFGDTYWYYYDFVEPK